ncbi:MAG TPA: DUF4838 domain-containing protein, partial [Terrimicrobiaceae bacterium]|nr:DUF4838 domain-containing protein [Terrimicrobiaceae bacterium]
MTQIPHASHRRPDRQKVPKLLLTALAAACPLAGALAESTVWNKDQLSRATIYYSEKNVPPPPVRGPVLPADITAAAADLQEYLAKITGVKLPVEKRDSAGEIPSGAPAIVLGALARELGAAPPATEFLEDGYVLERQGDRLLIAGESDRGTAYGVADFLARQGVRFYMPGPFGEDVPKRETLIIPDAVSETPDWEDRRLWLMGGAGNRFENVAPEVPGWFRDWQRRNRVSTADRVATSHMWAQVFPSAGITREEALQKHPDWFVTVNGTRNPRHLNLLNDEVVDLFVNHLRKQLAGQPKDIRRVLSLSPDDQVIVNDSIEARQLLSRKDLIFTNLPDATDYLIQFNNRVVQRLNQEYPNVRLAFYIYSNYQNAPTDVALDKNLIPFIAPLNFSRYHALSDSSKSNRTLLASIVNRWHAQGAKLGWRDYAFLCPDAMVPFTRLHMTRRDIPWLHERGARYISTETVSNWPNLLPEYWLLAGLLWDVKLDQEAALTEFYDRFFGPAAKPMRAYIDEVSDMYNSLPFSAGNKEFVESTFTPERLRSLRENIDSAKRAVSGDDIRLHRVKLVETALNQAQRFLRLRAAINRFDYAEAAKIDQEILQAWDDDIAFDGLTNTMFVKDRWHRRYFSDHITRINEWLEGAKVLYVFPDEWPAHFDLTQTGASEGLMLPESRAFELFSLKTYSRSLAEQGWEKFRGDI